MSTYQVCRLYDKEDMRIDTEELAPLDADKIRVKLAYAGICGTDLHYFYHAGFGKIRVKEPFIIGHELSGVISEIGENYQGELCIGDSIAINPSLSCGQCQYCQQGDFNHCLDVYFLGSASRTPHINGGFRECIDVEPARCVKLPFNADRKPDDLQVSQQDATLRINHQEERLAKASLIEPLAVCLHALTHFQGFDAQNKQSLANKKVLITGAGPIGALMTSLCHYFGASEIIVCDITDFTLETAIKLGATDTVNVKDNSEKMQQYTANKGYFDISFECSSAPAAIESCVDATHPNGQVILIGMLGSIPMPMDKIQQKELRVSASFRFNTSFELAVSLIDKLNLEPVMTHVLHYSDIKQAMDIAKDRNKAIKVLLSFNEK